MPSRGEKSSFRGVRLLEELDGQGQQLDLGEGEVILEDRLSSSRAGKPSVSVGWSRERMYSGTLVGRLVLVHRHARRGSRGAPGS